MNIVFAEPIGLSSDQKLIFYQEMTKLGHRVEYFDSIPLTQDDLLARTKEADILVVSNYQVSEAVVGSSQNLKLIAVAFTGVDHIPLHFCMDKGISVCNAAGYSTQAVAELTIALAIELLRKIVPFDATTREGGTRAGFLGSELHDKIFGVVGFGAIGQRVAYLAQAFGCKVVAFSRTTKNIDGVEFMCLNDLLRCADIVSLHLPLTDQTKGLMDKERLKLMKSSSILINTARGSIVNSTALADSLRNGEIAGAAIDVYEHEPPIEKNHQLITAPNTILLPHIGFATKEAIELRSKITIENIKRWLSNSI